VLTDRGGCVRAGQSREPEGGHEEVPDKRRRPLPYDTLRQIHEEDLALVHDPAEIQRRAGSGEHPMDPRVSQEGTHLVLHRSEHLGAQALRVAGELAAPERADLVVAEPLDYPLPEGIVVEEARDVGEGCTRYFEESEEDVPEDVFKARSPGIGPDLLERLDKPGRSQGLLLGSHSRKRVEAKLKSRVREVEVEKDRTPLFRDRLDNTLDKIAVGIEQGQPFAVSQIAPDERLKKR